MHLAPGRLDLDHVGAEVGQHQGGVGAGGSMGHVDDAEPGEGAGRLRLHRSGPRRRLQVRPIPRRLRFVGSWSGGRSVTAAQASSKSASPRWRRVAMRTTWDSSRRVGVWAARKRAAPARIRAPSSEPAGQAWNWRTAAS